MIYVCGNCKFCFERLSDIEQCPDCGKFVIRVANEDEKLDYVKNKE